MIFSKFFKAKWQHKESNVRITAIKDELDPNNPQDLTILKQLLLSDESELVRRAVLLKINTFELWLSTSSENSNAKIKEYARQQIVKMLNGEHELVLTHQQKQLFLTDNTYKSLLEPWLNNETDSDVIISLIEKINKPHLIANYFNQKQNEQVQCFLVDQTDDQALLEKFVKKAVNDSVLNKITHKLTLIKEKKDQPEKLGKKVQLILSKLLALKEQSDYGIYIDKHSTLEQEWQEASLEFACLTSEEAANFTEKYQRINEQLTKTFVAKAEAHQQKLIKQQLDAEKQQATTSFDKQLAELGQTLTTSIFETNEVDENAFNQQLITLAENIKASVLNADEKSAYAKSIKQLATRLTQLPEIAQSVSEATALISKISQLAIPSTLEQYNERYPIFNEWNNQWREIQKQTQGILPSSIKEAHQEIQSAWQQGLKPFAAEQKSLFTQTQKKMNDLKRLLASGKYNASFGLFKGVSKNYQQLSSNQQQRLERDYENVSKKIAELSDWEHYIATPRKQQLLDDINQIVACPLDNPNEQANKVKQFRKSWNLLGHADDEVDAQLNEAFNLACEKAFAPCRLFFSEQEKLREQHFIIRQEIITQAKAITPPADNDINFDFKALDGQLNKLQQAWSEAGEVDREKYKALQNQYTAIVQPLKAAVRIFHDDNATRKQGLIDKVSLELDNEDIYKAIDNTKKLQEKWREIGFAGPRQDNKLWQNFRAVNDQLFKKRDALKSEEKEQQSAQKVAFEKQLQTIKSQLSDILSADPDKGQLHSVKQELASLHQSVIDEKPVIKSVVTNIERVMSDIDNQMAHLTALSEQKGWVSLFTVLEDIAANKITADSLKDSKEFSSLSPVWQKRLTENLANKASDTSLARQDKTVELEIIAGVESPEEFAQQRMAIQIQLMQEKMTSGQDINLEHCFSEWLQQGQLSADDMPLISRIKPIFCS